MPAHENVAGNAIEGGLAIAGNCAIFRSWNTGDLLTATDLTTSFTQVGVTNMTQTCIDDFSIDTNQFRSTVDPYPGSVASLPTSGAGELERIRYVLKKIAGWTQWYAHTEALAFPGDVSTVGDLTVGDQLKVTGVGPHAIGGATISTSQLRMQGTLATGRRGLELLTRLQPGDNLDAFLVQIAGTIDKSGAGTHADFAALELEPPTITAGVAALTNATTLKITGAPTGGTNNYTLWVAAGVSRLDEKILFGANSALGGASGDTAIYRTAAGFLQFQGFTGGYSWVNNANSSERMRLTDGGILALGTTQTAGAAAGYLVLANNKALAGVNAAGTSSRELVSYDAADRLRLGPLIELIMIGSPASSTGAAAGDVVFANDKSVRFTNAAGTSAVSVLSLNASNTLFVGAGAGVIAFGSPVSIGGAAAGDVVLASASVVRAANNAGTSTVRLIDKNTSDEVLVGGGGSVVRLAGDTFTVNASGKITEYTNAAPTDGQLLIGGTAAGNFTAATLTAGTGITITNGNNTITIANSGSTALNINNTSQATTGTVKETLATFSIPANTLSANTKTLRIKAWFITAANANSKTMGIDFGATTVATFTTSQSGHFTHLEAIVSRTSANNQTWVGKADSWNAANGFAANYTQGTSTETDTGAITLNVFGTTPTAAGDVTFKGVIVELLG